MSVKRNNKLLSILCAGLSIFLALTPAATAFASGNAVKADAPSEWAEEDVVKAREYGLIPDNMYHSFMSDITRVEFCRLVMALYTKITSMPETYIATPAFTDTSNISVLNAYELGIVKGVGDGRFAPYAAITRQEIAVMLNNAIGVISDVSGKDILDVPSATLTFTDLDLAAEWAIDAIISLRTNEIMLGDDKNRFNPLDNTTKEMAFILVNRIYLIYSGLDAKKSFPAAYTGEILMRIKGVFINGHEYQIIGDVYESYPAVTTKDLNNYLNGGAFNDGSGKAYYIDKSESLSESVAAGYTGGAGGLQYYPVYVLVSGASPYGKLYIVRDGNEYGIFNDSDRGDPFLLKTFSDVLFTVPENTAVYPGGGETQFAGFENGFRPDAGDSAAGETGINSENAGVGNHLTGASGAIEQITFAELFHDAQELFDSYVWLVQLTKGKVTRMTAYIFD